MNLLQALRLWVASDRIRASPREGRLLRLRPGSCVRVGGGTFAEVVSRHVPPESAPDAGVVRYECRGPSGRFSLVVRATGAGAGRVRVVSATGETRDVPAGDVDAFGTGRA